MEKLDLLLEIFLDRALITVSYCFRAHIRLYTNENLMMSSLVHELMAYVDVGGVYTVVATDSDIFTVNLR